jgi:hypothetical protein
MVRRAGDVRAEALRHVPAEKRGVSSSGTIVLPEADVNDKYFRILTGFAGESYTEFHRACETFLIETVRGALERA